MNNFHVLGVVGRGSETQLQVREILNKLIQQEYCVGRIRFYNSLKVSNCDYSCMSILIFS